MPHKRIVFDSTLGFSHGGGLQGQDFRLDLPTDPVFDAEPADHRVRDMGLLMVERGRILKKRIVVEPHER